MTVQQRADTPITVDVDGQQARVNGAQIKVPSGTDPAMAAIHHVARTIAAPRDQPVSVVASDEEGTRLMMLVHPDGHTSDRRVAPDASPSPVVPLGTRRSTRTTPVAQLPSSPPPSRPASEGISFLTPTMDAPISPSTGLRALLERIGLVSSGPSEHERRERAQTRAVAQRWPGPRSVAVANGKGGSGKTPSAILLAAMFARLGGAGVLLEDCNVTRGTAGWRTEQGPHEATVLQLAANTDRLLSTDAQAADLAAFVHHQTDDVFDVLRSNPLLLSTQQKLTVAQREAVHAVARKFYRLIFMDSGNDEGDELWLQMIDSADRLVVPTTTRPDHAEAARLLLLGLADRDEESARKSREAVVLVLQADREETGAQRVAEGFEGQVGSVVTLPYDAALRQQWLRVDALSQASRAAWLTAAAAVAEGL